MDMERTTSSAATVSSDNLGALEWPGLPTEYYETRWYAAYTSSNHEKRVAEQMGVRGVEHFLPLYASIRRWRNGRVKLQRPLFPGYVFVRIALREKLRVQQIPGVAWLVGFNGRPSRLADEEIEALRKLMVSGIRAEPFPFLTVGRRVRICTGPLSGREGFVVWRKGILRVVLSINHIQRAILVEVDTDALEPLVSLRHHKHDCGEVESFEGKSKLWP
jgi:transcription antitermination factor NusG